MSTTYSKSCRVTLQKSLNFWTDTRISINTTLVWLLTVQYCNNSNTVHSWIIKYWNYPSFNLLSCGILQYTTISLFHCLVLMPLAMTRPDSLQVLHVVCYLLDTLDRPLQTTLVQKICKLWERNTVNKLQTCEWPLLPKVIVNFTKVTELPAA